MLNQNRRLPVITALLLLGSVAQATLPPLVPRTVLFGNPEKMMARLSPDGKWMTYLAPSSAGVLNIWLQELKPKKPAVMISNDLHRGIRKYGWAYDKQHLLYMQDQAGDENWHLYSVDIQSHKVVDLTPYPKVRATNLMLEKNYPQQILIGLNKRDPRVFDMYRIDLSSGKMTLDTLNPGDVEGWLADNNFQIRAASASNNQDGSTSLRVRTAKKDSPWKTVMTWAFGENGGPIAYSKDNNSIYITNNLHSDTAVLQLIDGTTGKVIKTLANNPQSDVDEVLMSDISKQVQAVQFNYLKPEWTVLDDSVKQDFKRLQTAIGDNFKISSRDIDEKLWLIASLPDNASLKYYLYERATGKITPLFTAQPALDQYQLSHMQAEIIPARDGMKLVSYLSLPLGVAPKNLPLVLNVHGGPWARDDWGFDATTQWLVNRGYAVLQVNYRGSTGFGKRFLNAGNGQWGTGTMQDDLTDATKWAIAKGYADPKKICIYGGSYGGYAVLAGLSFTPDLYTCGVDIVGPADLQTLMASIPPYWTTGKKEMLLRIGDVEKNNAFNQKISPLYHVDKIRAPLLIAQGANDPRVKIQQADMIVKAMEKKKLGVEYIVYTDEGHGFARPENRMDFYGRAEAFLGKYLNGRIQPWVKIPGSSAEVRGKEVKIQ